MKHSIIPMKQSCQMNGENRVNVEKMKEQMRGERERKGLRVVNGTGCAVENWDGDRTYPSGSSSAETVCLVLVLDVLAGCWRSRVQSICRTCLRSARPGQHATSQTANAPIRMAFWGWEELG